MSHTERLKNPRTKEADDSPVAFPPYCFGVVKTIRTFVGCRVCAYWTSILYAHLSRNRRRVLGRDHYTRKHYEQQNCEKSRDSCRKLENLKKKKTLVRNGHLLALQKPPIFNVFCSFFPRKFFLVINVRIRWKSIVSHIQRLKSSFELNCHFSARLRSFTTVPSITLAYFFWIRTS